eukprot:302662_1
MSGWGNVNNNNNSNSSNSSNSLANRWNQITSTNSDDFGTISRGASSYSYAKPTHNTSSSSSIPSAHHRSVFSAVNTNPASMSLPLSLPTNPTNPISSTVDDNAHNKNKKLPSPQPAKPPEAPSSVSPFKRILAPSAKLGAVPKLIQLISDLSENKKDDDGDYEIKDKEKENEKEKEKEKDDDKKPVACPYKRILAKDVNPNRSPIKIKKPHSDDVDDDDDDDDSESDEDDSSDEEEKEKDEDGDILIISIDDKSKKKLKKKKDKKS